MLHVHVLLVAPLGTGYMAQPGANQHEGRADAREGSRHTDPSADFPVQPFNHIVGANPGPVLAGKITVSQRFLNTVLHLLGSLFQFHFPKLGHHGFSLFTGSLFAFLGVDRPEHLSHQLYLGARNGEKHISVKMDCAALIFGLGKHISYGFQHSQTLVPNNELHAAHLDIWILTALQRTITPILNAGIRLLVQLADSGRRFLAAPKSFLNILHPAYRDAGEVYINGGFFYAATNRSLDLPPDYLLVQLYNLFGHGLQTPFRMVCANFILPDACKPCLFLSSIQFAQFILPYCIPVVDISFRAMYGTVVIGNNYMTHIADTANPKRPLSVMAAKAKLIELP